MKCSYLFVAALLVSSVASGHGGVSIQDDICVMAMGPYRAHFTAYLPEQRGIQEFCEDLPVTGEAIIVVDFISSELRSHSVEFEVVRDFTGKGARADAADLAANPVSYSENLVHKDSAAVRSTGTLDFSVQLQSKGWYIGVMRAVDENGQTRFESVFPFEVGASRLWRYFVALFMALFLSGVLYWVSARRNKQ